MKNSKKLESGPKVYLNNEGYNEGYDFIGNGSSNMNNGFTGA